MAYTDDAVLAKLSSLNETQESIVTVSQWVMFHRRYADRTCQLWLQRLKDSGSNKRLNLIYLANEVVQQSKARRKEDFLLAFSPVIAEATALAYKGATNEVQQKLRRVVEVWRARLIFETPIQEAIETRIDELDKSRSSGKRGGGSIFASNSNATPSELVPLVLPQQTLSKLVLSTRTSVNAAAHDYGKYIDPAAAPPSAPVLAARLNGLLQKLANAEGAVAESIKARKALLEGLEKLLDTNRTALAAEEVQLAELTSQKIEIDNKRRDVEAGIMRGFASNSNPGSPTGDGSPGTTNTLQSPVTPGPEVNRPEVEALTPPGYPQPQTIDPIPDFDLKTESTAIKTETYSQYQNQRGIASEAANDSTYSRPSPIINLGTGSAKKRKLNGIEDGFPDLGGDAMDGLDADVAEMLRADTA